MEKVFRLPSTRQPTLGILSPFRNQCEAIREAIQKNFDQHRLNTLLNTHHLRIGTAHTFQGEERDVMLISFCADSSVGHSTLRFLERADVFNVSITRARSRQVVFHSLDANDLPHGSLLGEYLSSLEPAAGDDEVLPEPDLFSQEVARELRQRGVDVLPTQRVAGVSVDLLLIDGDKVMGIDLIGYPGETFAAVDRHRAKILRRAGFRLFPLGYTEWRTQQSHALSVMIHELRHDSRYW